MFARDGKRSSLFGLFMSDKEKFYKIGNWCKAYETFFFVTYEKEQ